MTIKNTLSWREKKQMQRYIDRLRLELQRCVQKHRYNFHHPELVALSQYVDRITDAYRAAFEAKMQTWLRRRYQRPLRELRALALQRGISPAGRTRLQLVQAIQESEKHAPCYGSATACIADCAWKQDCAKQCKIETYKHLSMRPWRKQSYRTIPFEELDTWENKVLVHFRP